MVLPNFNPYSDDSFHAIWLSVDFALWNILDKQFGNFQEKGQGKINGFAHLKVIGKLFSKKL